MTLRSTIQTHQSFWASPAEGDALLAQISAGEDVTSRMNWNGHATASALVLSADRSLVLMIDAVKFGKRLLPGGHLELGELVADAALRELTEETGVSAVRPLAFPDGRHPLEINSHWIEKNDRRSEPRHLHHDFIYPFLAEEPYPQLLGSSEEASSVLWVEVSELAVTYATAHRRLMSQLERLK